MTGIRLAVHLVVLIALGLGVSLPLLDHHVAERNPWHDHVVVAGSGLDREHALAFHRHGFETPHAHGPATDALTWSLERQGAGEGATVIVVQYDDGVGGSSSVGTGPVLLPSKWPAPLPPQFSNQRSFALVPAILGTVLPLPDPPPRISF